MTAFSRTETISRIRAQLRPLPIWVFLAITAGCLLLEENYPFTHNPMYSALSAELRYYYVTDQEGNIVPFRQAFGYSLIDLMRKIKDRRIKLMKEAGVPKKHEEDILRFERKALPEVLDWYFRNGRARGEFAGKPLPYRSITVVKILASRAGKTETVIGSAAIPRPGEEG